jgi:peptidyl-prolyl cis-trans isomerase A (cyclophilin A)
MKKILLLALAISACNNNNAKKPDAAPSPALLSPENATEPAPAEFKARFSTTKGDFVITVHRDWSPQGADRFYNLVKIGYYDNVAFFRAIKGFMVQFGIHGSPEVATKWRPATIKDDPQVQSNKKGYVTFAKGGPNSRTTQVFINYADNPRLDPMGFPPFGEVTEGWDVVEKLNTEYGEGAPAGKGPMQGRLQMEGNAYLAKEFPNMDYVKSAKIE